MSSEEQERRRLERLRQQQLGTRDPGASKIKGYDWSIHAQRSKALKRRRQSIFGEVFGVLPTRFRGVLIGGLVGSVGSIIILVLVPDTWKPLALVPLLICAIGGWVLGATIQENY
jgi:hypothetical protein